ncbi:MAG TPA: 16S rRNA (cytidine(1402)-2'-O)-methyltransferase [Anaerolineae bacterium]|nr:16S rRNA (cytidine(1402)-2'-O)-methyltransferase [Anaerolineae bacterium]
MSTLYLVPTPLGNLEDITLRALRVLREVNVIAAEDTRTARRLLSHFELKGRLISYHEHSGAGQTGQILQALAEDDVALISEAGTPLLSDPGFELVQTALEYGHAVVSLPGPSAITTALVASGLPPHPFLFAGFLPRKATDRRSFLSDLAAQTATLIVFESPHRLRQALADLVEIFGPVRSVAVCREMTKLHEEVWRGDLAGALQEWTEREPRGEFTLVIGGATAPETVWSEAKLEAALAQAMAAGLSAKDAVQQVKADSGWPKRKIYALVQKVQSAEA